MRVGKHPAQDNPFWSMAAYSLRNPMVCEAIARGAYDEITCPHCVKGRARDRWGNTYTCFICKGSGFRPSRELCAQDFGDEESLELAAQILPSLARERHTYRFNARHLR